MNRYLLWLKVTAFAGYIFGFFYDNLHIMISATFLYTLAATTQNTDNTSYQNNKEGTR